MSLWCGDGDGDGDGDDDGVEEILMKKRKKENTKSIESIDGGFSK